MWVRDIFANHCISGEYHCLLQELRLKVPQSHWQNLRMAKEKFDILVNLVHIYLSKRSYNSVVRAVISVAERLALTIRYLATGNSQVSLSFSFRVGKSTVSGILKETCKSLWHVLQPVYVKAPSNEEEWIGGSNQFERIWNFPNCLGAVDGKYIVIQAPANWGSTYINYKGTHSVVLMVVCDINYRFILVDVGDAGCQSDRGVFANSDFGQGIENQTLHIPRSRPFPGTSAPDLLCVFVGDEGFPLKENMLQPYPGRRIIKNTYGILAARWQIFHRPIIANPDNVVLYTKAAIGLHNFLQSTESLVYCPSRLIELFCILTRRG